MELRVARVLFRMKRGMGTPDSFRTAFRDEQQRIMELLNHCPDGQRGRAVLILRLPGLEDSSRQWSVWMTMEHLRITNLGMAGIIDCLLRDEQPPGVVRTAEVKPATTAGPEVETQFADSCDALLRAAGEGNGLRTIKRHAHPWFGPLDARGWLAMAAMHMGIHRKQIEAIRAGMG